MSEIIIDPKAARACETDRQVSQPKRILVLQRLNRVTRGLASRCGTDERYHYNLAAARDEMIAWANRLHHAYPQYQDYWNKWILCRAKREITPCCAEGDLLLLNPMCEVRVGIAGTFIAVQVWSMRTGNNYGLNAQDVAIL